PEKGDRSPVALLGGGAADLVIERREVAAIRSERVAIRGALDERARTFVRAPCLVEASELLQREREIADAIRVPAGLPARAEDLRRLAKESPRPLEPARKEMHVGDGEKDVGFEPAMTESLGDRERRPVVLERAIDLASQLRVVADDHLRACFE